MPSDMFLKIKGIQGESTDDKHKGEIEVMAYSHNVDQPTAATLSGAGGRSAGRCRHGEFHITKLIDQATPQLAQKCCTGEHLDEMVLTVNRASGEKGGVKLPCLVYTLTNVIISQVAVAGANDSGLPTENVALSYGTIKWEYTRQDPQTGGPSTKTSAGWDCEKGKPK